MYIINGWLGKEDVEHKWIRFYLLYCVYGGSSSIELEEKMEEWEEEHITVGLPYYR